MTGQLKMSCISSYSGHFSYLYFLIVRTQCFFRSFGQSVSVYDAFVFRRARQLTNISAEQERFACQSVRSSVSLMRVHPAMMHAKLLFNDKR